MFLSPATILSARRSCIYLRRVPTAWNASSSVVSSGRSMATIVEGVDFDTTAREWRCKWSVDDDKKSLAELQKILNDSKEELRLWSVFCWSVSYCYTFKIWPPIKIIEVCIFDEFITIW